MLYNYHESEILLSKGIFDKIVEPYRELSNLGKNFILDRELLL